MLSKLTVVIAVILLVFSPPLSCVSAEYVSILLDGGLRIDTQNSSLSFIANEVEKKLNIKIQGKELLEDEEFNLQRQFSSPKASLDSLLRNYSKVYIYDKSNKIVEVRIIGRSSKELYSERPRDVPLENERDQPNINVGPPAENNIDKIWNEPPIGKVIDNVNDGPPINNEYMPGPEE